MAQPDVDGAIGVIVSARAVIFLFAASPVDTINIHVRPGDGRWLSMPIALRLRRALENGIPRHHFNSS